VISNFKLLFASNSHDKNCDFERKVCNKIKARETTLSLLKTVVEKSLELINICVEKLRKDPLVYKYLGESATVNVLLPLVLAHIGPLISFSKDAKVPLITSNYYLYCMVLKAVKLYYLVLFGFIMYF